MADESKRSPQQTHPSQGGADDPGRKMEAENAKDREKREKAIAKSQEGRTPDGSAEEQNAVAYGGLLGGSKVYVPEGLHESAGDAPYSPPRHNGGEWATPSKSKSSKA